MESRSTVLPNLIIGGVFKAGTTSLFTYLSQHPSIGVSSKKELGYFVPLQFGKKPEGIEEYTKYFSHLDALKFNYIMEASPGYLFGGKNTAQYMKENLPDFKIIFILRDPGERLISFYKYLNGYLHSYEDLLSEEQREFIGNMTFESYIEKSYQYALEGKNDENIEYILSGVKYSLYSSYIKEW